MRRRVFLNPANLHDRWSYWGIFDFTRVGDLLIATIDRESEDYSVEVHVALLPEDQDKPDPRTATERGCHVLVAESEDPEMKGRKIIAIDITDREPDYSKNTKSPLSPK